MPFLPIKYISTAYSITLFSVKHKSNFMHNFLNIFLIFLNSINNFMFFTTESEWVLCEVEIEIRTGFKNPSD
jgi:hypothetical protein